MRTAVIAIAVVLCFVAATATADTCAQCHAKGHDWVCPSDGKCHNHHFECWDCKGPCEPTKQCASCSSDGYNCDCPQCSAKGFDYFCTTAKTCYHSEDTCKLSCASDRDCVPTKSFCPAKEKCSGNGNCGPSQTCCIDASTQQPFCAPYANATCCNFGNMTCNQGFVCDPPTHSCKGPDPNPSSSCKLCEKIVAYASKKATCEGICEDIPIPGTSVICPLLVKLGLCKKIDKYIGLHYTPEQICALLGLCGDGSCSCGYCQPSLYGQACLSLPNKCPPPLPPLTQFALMARAEEAAKHGKDGKKPLIVPGADFCVDGHCEAGNDGCCLTCAP